jgi:nucleotide-binding universal stress UspA family protein
MLPIHTILHPTDFSPQSAYACQVACALARDYGARVVFAHVREPQPIGAYGEFGALPVEPAEPREMLEARLDRLQAPDVSVPVAHFLVDGDPAEEILRLAREQNCSLIVMGTHGRSGLRRLLVGSVAEQVLRRAPCPVLTLKTPQEEALPLLAVLDEPALM